MIWRPPSIRHRTSVDTERMDTGEIMSRWNKTPTRPPLRTCRRLRARHRPHTSTARRSRHQRWRFALPRVIRRRASIMRRLRIATARLSARPSFGKTRLHKAAAEHKRSSILLYPSMAHAHRPRTSKRSSRTCCPRCLTRTRSRPWRMLCPHISRGSSSSRALCLWVWGALRCGCRPSLKDLRKHSVDSLKAETPSFCAKRYTTLNVVSSDNSVNRDDL